MNDRILKYPNYKSSGIEWLGEVPKHWQVEKLKFFVKLNSRKIEFDEDTEIQKVALENIESGTGKLIYGGGDKSFEGKGNPFVPGDILFNKLRPYLAKVACPDFHGLAVGELLVLSPNSEILDSRFLFYRMLSNQFIKVVDNSTYGAKMPRANWNYIGNLKIGIPAIEEQQTIAAFLNHQTARIDQLIQKKNHLLELLDEQRRMLITQTVTKGLHPEAPMKDSGIEWLGEVPEHWKVSKLKYFYDVQLGKMLQNDPKNNNDVLIPYLRAANLQWGGVDLSDLNEMWFSPKETEKYKLQAGDLLISEGGDIGRSSIWNGEIECIGIQNAINRVRPKDDVLSQFLYYWIYSLKHLGWIDILCNKATIAHFTAEKVEGLDIVVPPFSEQQAIAALLDRETTRIDRLKAKIKEAVERLEEYRASLISRAVTGKIDLREKIAQTKSKKSRANIYFKRTVLAARILDELHSEPTMGRRKLQKNLYLLEMHIEQIELKGKYVKAAAGPFDNKMMRSVEKQLKSQNWFVRKQRKNGYGYKYIPGEKKNGYQEYYPRYWGRVESEIKEFIELVRTEKTDLLSCAATIYACWNDFILKDSQFDGKQLINESKYNWHKGKRKIPYQKWKESLLWLWDNDIKPRGSGELTKEI